MKTRWMMLSCLLLLCGGVAVGEEAYRAATTRSATTRAATTQSTNAQSTTAQAEEASSAASTEAVQKQAENLAKGKAKFEEGEALMLKAKGFVKGEKGRRKKEARASQISDEQKVQYYTNAIKCFNEAVELGYQKAAKELKEAQGRLNKLQKKRGL